MLLSLSNCESKLDTELEKEAEEEAKPFRQAEVEAIAATTTSRESATAASCMCNFLNDPLQLPTKKNDSRSRPTNLINLENNAFSRDRYVVERSKDAAKQAKSRSVNCIMNPLVNTILKKNSHIDIHQNRLYLR